MASRAGDRSWTRFPIARLRYTQSKRMWTLYWRDRNLKFHLYEAAAPTQTIDELLDEIDADRTGIFWGFDEIDKDPTAIFWGDSFPAFGDTRRRR